MTYFSVIAFCRISREKSKRIVGIVLILHQMEENALRHMQILIFFCQIQFYCAAVACNLSAENPGQPLKYISNPSFCYIFCSDSKRNT